MKRKLMVLSLSPLALLTIIRNSCFVFMDNQGVRLSTCNFFQTNGILLAVLTLCIVWLIISVGAFFEFNAFKWSDKKSGYEVNICEDKEDASLNFFLTLIIPLLLDDVGTITGALTFAILVLLICLLLYRTSLFYANPILALLGYRVYTFEFVDNPEKPKGCYIGLANGQIGSDAIEYKEITEKVFYIKGLRK